ncbi:MAG: hypothetical protein LBS49_07925 [Candidatus Accumulibacter sp.]|jgi:hypothetical protein|nr:hypothetical protein [Accumulibacter sp.]
MSIGFYVGVRFAHLNLYGLVPGLSREDFFHCRSMPRNRVLMRVFRDVELVESLGSGMTRILRVYAPSIFELTPSFLVVTFKFSEGFREEATSEPVHDLFWERDRAIALCGVVGIVAIFLGHGSPARLGVGTKPLAHTVGRESAAPPAGRSLRRRRRRLSYSAAFESCGALRREKDRW